MVGRVLTIDRRSISCRVDEDLPEIFAVECKHLHSPMVSVAHIHQTIIGYLDPVHAVEDLRPLGIVSLDRAPSLSPSQCGGGLSPRNSPPALSPHGPELVIEPPARAVHG